MPTFDPDITCYFYNRHQRRRYFHNIFFFFIFFPKYLLFKRALFFLTKIGGRGNVSMNKKPLEFEKSREYRCRRGAQLYRLGKVIKRNGAGGGKEFEIRDGGSLHRVYKRDGKSWCSCFEFALYRKQDYRCEHFFAVKEFLLRETESGVPAAATAFRRDETDAFALRAVTRRLAAVPVDSSAENVAEILNRAAPGWTTRIVRRQPLGTGTLLVLKLEIGGVSRQGIGFSEETALAEAAKKFGLFRAGDDDPAGELERVVATAGGESRRLKPSEAKSADSKTAAAANLRLVPSSAIPTLGLTRMGAFRTASPAQIIYLLELAKKIRDAGGEASLFEEVMDRFQSTLGAPSEGVSCNLSGAHAEQMIIDYQRRLGITE